EDANRTDGGQQAPPQPTGADASTAGAAGDREPLHVSPGEEHLHAHDHGSTAHAGGREETANEQVYAPPLAGGALLPSGAPCSTVVQPAPTPHEEPAEGAAEYPRPAEIADAVRTTFPRGLNFVAHASRLNIDVGKEPVAAEDAPLEMEWTGRALLDLTGGVPN